MGRMLYPGPQHGTRVPDLLGSCMTLTSLEELLASVFLHSSGLGRVPMGQGSILYYSASLYAIIQHPPPKKKTTHGVQVLSRTQGLLDHQNRLLCVGSHPQVSFVSAFTSCRLGNMELALCPRLTGRAVLSPGLRRPLWKVLGVPR